MLDGEFHGESEFLTQQKNLQRNIYEQFFSEKVAGESFFIFLKGKMSVISVREFKTTFKVIREREKEK